MGLTAREIIRRRPRSVGVSSRRSKVQEGFAVMGKAKARGVEGGVEERGHVPERSRTRQGGS